MVNLLFTNSLIQGVLYDDSIYRVSCMMTPYTECPVWWLHMQGVLYDYSIYRVSCMMTLYTGCPVWCLRIQGVLNFAEISWYSFWFIICNSKNNIPPKNWGVAGTPYYILLFSVVPLWQGVVYDIATIYSQQNRVKKVMNELIFLLMMSSIALILPAETFSQS